MVGPQIGKLELPGFNPAAQPKAEPDRKRCRCPKPKKARPGRGFFRVTKQGTVRKTYWKTGKKHTKEYRDASNPSRSVRSSGGKQLQHLRGLGV
jgi:hypothetical protein